MVIEITDRELSLEDLVAGAKRPDTGAVVAFLGTVRDDGISGVEVEAYREVAEEELARIRDEAMATFDLKSLDVVHRVGRLGVGEDIVLIVATAPHRQAAFRGCEFVLEEIKRRAPIWKKEIRIDGGERWV
jgi:molybdopterin synthase catalytic subunit